MSRRILLAAALLVMAAEARALAWTITSVDGPGDVGAYASIALDPSQNPAISYCASSTDDLRFARLVGAVWQVETVDAAGRTGWYTSLAFDSHGDPRIAYWDLSNSSLRFARWAGGVWTLQTVDNAAYVGQCCSLALDGSDQPSISYYDYTNGDLKLARWDGTAWQITVVDNGQALMGAGLYTSLALDSSGRPHISYADHTLGQLRYAWWNGSQWTIEVVDGGTPVGTSIRLDATGIPHISYAYQFGQGSHLKYAKRTGPGGSWITQIVKPGGQVGWYSSLCLRPNGEPSILSWDLGSSIVDYESYENGGWRHDSIEAMGFVDQWCSLVMDRSAHLHAAYRSASDLDLHYAVAANPAAAPEDADLANPPALAISIAPNPAAGNSVLDLRLARPSVVRLRILDVLGRSVLAPADYSLPEGRHELPLPRDLAAGVYLVRAEWDGGSRSLRYTRLR